MSDKMRNLRLAVLGAAAVGVLAPYAADSGACADSAAGNLLASAWLDSQLNGSGGEDLDFLYKDGGLPNIMVLFDSSMSMRLLPPDGPGKIGGPGSTKPPAGVVGCALDPVSQTTPGWATSQTVKGIQGRAFFPPCGNAVDPTLVQQPYKGQLVDYAANMTVCPYFTPSNNQATGAPGYDPDFYPTFFAKDQVFHDAALNGSWSNSNPFGDGWTDTTTYPFIVSGNKPGAIADFCKTQGTTLQGGLTRESICNTCLTTAGWYYDGNVLDPGNSTYAGTHPSLWYTGNYLNFFPPKFLVARKVMKDIVAVQSRVRMGLARFDGGTGATFVKDFNPSCGMPDGSSFDSNRSAYVSDLNSSTKFPFDGSTPLAQALFDIGRYYHSPDLVWFGPTWENPQKESASNANQFAICYSCQVSTVIVLTDGQPTSPDGSTLPPLKTTVAQTKSNLYAGDPTTGILGIGKPDCPWCADWAAVGSNVSTDYRDNLAKVAWYMQNMDLRKNTEITLDCKNMGGKQAIQTYTLGFATSQLPDANRILRNTASAGGGMFVAAENPSELKQGIENIIRDISTRATSFSVATVSTLQTTAGRVVLVPRFLPGKSTHWQGHLFRYDLYSEFVNDCTPFGAGDLDCDGKCQGTFLQENTGSDGIPSFVSEDGNGAFVRNDPSTVPTCTQAPACVTAGKSCAVPGSAPAVDFWDAGGDGANELTTRAWKTRRIYTAVDANKDGRIDRHDPTFELVSSSDASANSIVPYLGLGTGPGGSVCQRIANALTSAGDFASAALVTANKTECAKTLIRYLKGADVFNEAGATTGWPPTDPENLPDRAFKLGDIFHSSPVLVEPPYPRTGIQCAMGLASQCLEGLWKTPTKRGETGYDEFSLHPDLVNRDKIVLVGANDGLLHAFHAGKWIPNPTPGVHNDSADDKYTSKVDESLPPFNGFYDRGTSSELWAFLPPDMIGKLPLLFDSQHQFFVDGSPWVRDVWVDGSDTGLSGLPAPSLPDQKEGREFHTVAVVGERRGGTRFFALDVTRATDGKTAPTFLWVYPQPDDPESLAFGETYNETLPLASPIVPVRIEATPSDTITGVTNSKSYPTGAGTATAAYHERWVVWLNGGFDPQYVRGRGVHAVDVWTGDELFDFSYPKDPTAVPAGDPRLSLVYPVAAPVGCMAWGSTAQQQNASAADHEYFFDSATFGDTGGQLWTLRFYAPGKRGPDGRVTNWYGARLFQMGGPSGCTLCGNNPFFYLTNNIRLAERRYRAAAGTGDRFNLLDLNGGTCGPDNVRACVQRGCTVTLDPGTNFLQAPDLGFSKRGFTQAACLAPTRAASDGAIAACTIGGQATISITGCPGGLATIKNTAANCTLVADGYVCNVTSSQPGNKLSVSDATNPITVGNWFFNLLVFEDSGPRGVFWDAAGAQGYDGARIWVTQGGIATFAGTPGLVLRSAKDNAAGTLASDTDKGWAVHYDHGPTETIGTVTYTVDWRDERTSSVGAVGSALMTWHTTMPSSASTGTATATGGGCRVSKCTEENRRVAYQYAADPKTGQPVFQDSTGALIRSLKGSQLVPSQGDQKTVFINQSGQVAVGLTAVNPESGASTVGMSEPEDPTADAGFVEVDTELHACRHVDAAPVCK